MTPWNTAVSEAIEACLQADQRAMLFLSSAAARCDAERFENTYGLHRVFRGQLTPGSLAGLGAGSASTGARTIVELSEHASITQTIGHLADHIANAQYFSAGRVQMPLFIRAVVGHVNEFVDEFSVANIPGMHVAVPASVQDAKAMTQAAFELTSPVLLLEQQTLLESPAETNNAAATSILGRATVKRMGGGLTLITVGADVERGLEAANSLAAEGIDVEVIDLRCLAPIDLATVLTSCQKTRRVLIADQPNARGGWSAELAAQINLRAFSHLERPVLRCSDIQGAKLEASPVDELVQAAKLASSSRSGAEAN